MGVIGATTTSASTIEETGALAFGIVLGWYCYYINRYRTDKVQISDVATFLGAVGGGAVLTLFPAKSTLFGYYGLGLAIGFFAYFVILFIIVLASGYKLSFFIDGRVPKLGDQEEKTDQKPMLRDGEHL